MVEDEIPSENSNVQEAKTINQKPPIALIMKGGGIKGLAYVGALEVLFANGYSFNWFAGTSAGAITAVLLGAGYSTKELEIILKEKNFNDFRDAGFFKKIGNLIRKRGLYEANTFRDWMDDLLLDKVEKSKSSTANEVLLETLAEITTYRVSVYASREGLNAQIFDSADERTSNVPASFAVRSSMAIPFFFTPTSVNGYDVVDGGMQNNFPANIFLKSNPGTAFIGLYLGPERFKRDYNKGYFAKMFSIWTDANDIYSLKEYQNETIVIDPSPISTFDFVLTAEEKEFLLEGGRLAALKFQNRREGIALPNDYISRKEIHENVREALKKQRENKKKLKLLKWVGAIIIAISSIWLGLYLYRYIFKHSSDYKQEIINSLGFEASFLKIKPGVSNSGKIPCKLNTLNDDGEPMNDFLENNFEKITIENYNDLIKEIEQTENHIRLKFHFSDVSNYNGFKFVLNNFKSPEDGIPLLQNVSPNVLWTKYSAYKDNGNQPYEFLLDDCLKTGNYNFTVEIHKP